MTDHDLVWEQYARLQKICMSRTKIDARSFAMEAGLDHLLDLQASQLPIVSVPDEVRATVGRVRRREHSRAGILRRVETSGREEFRLSIESNFESALQARDQLRRLTSALAPTDEAILIGVARGDDGPRIARDLDMKAANVRQRLARMRASWTALLAA
ncbi:hypothetical protein NKI46_02570 [Mesorhizobium sp. M0615]|uniref:hypothetical protein n=1 Tax=Mesorhizobium sp. M0615 TaxID=2956971 RepID=UPI00333C6B4B